MPRFLCCGDLHLDAGPDLGRAPGDRLREQEQVWRRCLEISVEQEVDAILFAGDAFHKARPTPEAMLAFERPLIHTDRDITSDGMIAVLGNHDVAGVALGTGLEVFAEAGLLTLAREPAIHAVAGVSIVCLPWVAASRIVAAQGGGDRDDVNEIAAKLLIEIARGLREEVSGPAILLTHFSISGSALPNGLPVEQLREPVLELGELEALGFDAIIAGHIHRPQLIGEAGAFYVGSPLPLNFGEADDEHGVWILETDPVTASERERPLFVPRFVPVESRPLVNLARDAYGVEQWFGNDPENSIPGFVNEAVVKLTLSATQEEARRIDIGAVKRALIAAGAHKVWAVQLEVEKPERARVEGLSEDLDELAALELWLAASDVNGDQASAMRERTAAYLGLVRS
jgi:exonuclease SbcD